MRGGIGKIFMTYQGTQDAAFSNFSLTLKESDKMCPAEQQRRRASLCWQTMMACIQCQKVSKRNFHSLKGTLSKGHNLHSGRIRPEALNYDVLIVYVLLEVG